LVTGSNLFWFSDEAVGGDRPAFADQINRAPSARVIAAPMSGIMHVLKVEKSLRGLDLFREVAPAEDRGLCERSLQY
jgi:hypothetical protein